MRTSRGRLGFTLFEAVVSLGVVGAFLVLMGGMFFQANRACRDQDERIEAVHSLKAAYHLLTSDVEQAVACTPDGSALAVDRVRPARLPSSLAAEKSTPGERMVVTYKMRPETRDLVRTWRQDGQERTAIVCTDVTGFASRRVEAAIQVALSVEDSEGVVRTLRWHVEPLLAPLPGAEVTP